MKAVKDCRGAGEVQQEGPVAVQVTQKALNSAVQQSDNEAICHLREAIALGREWHLALLEAIGLWTLPEETYEGRHYQYIIDGEAFDWLLLAERLCQAVNDLLPQEEMLDLLLFGCLPKEVSGEAFRSLVGENKYREHLNYLYGVTVEQTLQLAVEEEIYKECQAVIFSRRGLPFEDSYQRIYGLSQDELVRRFRKERSYPQRATISLSQLCEFTYWLFKYRLRTCDRAKVASDTQKALKKLEALKDSFLLAPFWRLLGTTLGR